MLELNRQVHRQLGMRLSRSQLSALDLYERELSDWNTRFNLTAIRDPQEIHIKHFLDSLLYIKAFPEGELKLIDAGTGAGFPGIPIRIVRPEINITLVESSRKKTAFLRHIARSLGLADLKVLEQRFEHLGEEHERAYDLIVSRATFGISEFLKIACPYVREGGRLILNKGPKLPEELIKSGAAEAVKEVLRLRLPITNDERNLVILECKKTVIC